MRAQLLLALAVFACGSPPAPVIPPREEIGPPLPAANDCFPPYTLFAQSWFILADLDLGTSCRVFLEQDECVLGIFDDCTDPSATSRQWIGAIDSAMMRDLIEFQIHEGSGASIGRPPKCCSGRLMEKDWAHLDCRLTACDNVTDTVHVGAILERAAEPDPFAAIADREVLDETRAIRDFALLPGKGEIWAIAGDAILVHPLGGETMTVGFVTEAQHLVVAPHEGTAYVADGRKLLRIDTIARQVSETVELGGPIDLLEYSDRGILTGVTGEDEMTLSLRRAGSIASVDAESRVPRLSAIVELPNGTNARTFLAAELNGDLLVLTSTLAAGAGPTLEKPARALHPIGTQAIGFLAECSERSTEEHCWFELDLATNAIRRTGIPDIGGIAGVAYDDANDRVLFGGGGGLGVLDRAAWRPLVQRRVPIEGIGPIALDGSDLYALSPEGGFAEHLTLE